jgi:hypothetical protein
LIRAVKQLNKGVILIGYKIVLMRQEIARLRKVVEVVTEVKGRKRKYIRVVESLTVGEVTNLIAKREGSRQEEGREPIKKVRKQRRYGRCGETSYNARTCAIEIIDLSNSENSE